MKEWTTDHRHWYRTVYLKSEHWKHLRISKLESYPACERCGSRDRIEPHHIRYKNLFDVQLSDLETLCRKCHTLEHLQRGLPRRNRSKFRRNWFDPKVLKAIKDSHEQFKAFRKGKQGARRVRRTRREASAAVERRRQELLADPAYVPEIYAYPDPETLKTLHSVFTQKTGIQTS